MASMAQVGAAGENYSVGADSGDQKYGPGEITAAEGPVNPEKPPSNDELKKKLKENYTNLEDVFPKVVSEFRQLILGYRVEGIVSRRWEAMRTKQGHLYWMGIQGGYYDVADWQWHMPFGTNVGLGLCVDDGDEDYDTPEYDYVLNYYQAYGLDYIALMSAAIPTPKFYPRSAQNEDDVTTAKAADDVRKLNEKNNNPMKLAKKNGWLGWCDGKIGAYVRWVRDGARFGFEEISDIQPDLQKTGGDMYVCPNCGEENEVQEGQETAGTDLDNDSGQDGDEPPTQGDQQPLTCKACGMGMTSEDFRPADYVPIPKAGEPRRVAKGQVLMSLIPGLQFHTPPWADEQSEFPYLQWNLEVHKAKLKASYPHAAKKIGSGGPTSADDVQMRAWRLQVQQGMPVTQPGDALATLVTFSRTWIRTWSFWEVEDEGTRELMLDLFPDGAYVAFAGDAFCEARNEPIEKCWRVSHVMEGDGQNRPSVGDSSVQVCAQINDLSNLEQETADYTIPLTLLDAETFNSDAVQNSKARPGDSIPVKTRPGESVDSKMAQTAPTVLSDSLVKRRQELAGPVLQQLSGIQPATFGADDAPGDAAAKYSMKRQQALRRIGMFWGEWKNLYSEMHLLGVECFRDNATGDAELTNLEDGGGFESKYIRLADLKGNIEVYLEPDDSFPDLPSEVKSIALQMLTNEMIGPIIAKEPGNIRQIKDMNGLEDFTIPGEAADIKMMRQIKLLLQSAPIQPPPQLAPGPMGPQPMQPPAQPTIEPDPILDEEDIPVYMSTIRRWWQSDAGQEAAMNNPNGVANIRAYYQSCKQIAAQQQAGNGQEKPPAESINYKDLPPDGQAQMAAQAGIKVDPVALAAKQQADDAQKAQQNAAKLKGLQAGKS